jgi:hypothetical protein
MKRFNTAGPCHPNKHYMIPATRRLPDVQRLVQADAYFVVHGPRQAGKTTALRAIAEELTRGGHYAALHVSCEACEPAGNDYESVQRFLLELIRHRAQQSLPAMLQPPATWPEASELGLLYVGLSAWAKQCPKPIVLFLDEIDALRGESLRSVLRQIRAGFSERPEHFPASMVLCGLHDVRSYQYQESSDPTRRSLSPVNIRSKSLRIGDFSRDEIAELYAQHSESTGQWFGDEAIERVFERTQGQVWLVNALAQEILEEMRVPLGETITVEHVDEAEERLLAGHSSHLDSLAQKTSDPGVRAVLFPILSGGLDVSARVDRGQSDRYDEDVTLVRDLGLVTTESPLRFANPIYRERVYRTFCQFARDKMVVPPWAPDERLDLTKVLEQFVEIWARHGRQLAAREPYGDLGPMLVWMAYLQRLMHGRGYLEHVCSVDQERVDVRLRWRYARDGQPEWQHESIGVTTWVAHKPDPVTYGLHEVESHLREAGLERGGWVIFDRRQGQSDQTGGPPVRLETVRGRHGTPVVLLRA